MMDRFFVVLREDDLRIRRHEGEKEALEEATRLCEKEGKSFFVLGVEYWVGRDPGPIRAVQVSPEPECRGWEWMSQKTSEAAKGLIQDSTVRRGP